MFSKDIVDAKLRNAKNRESTASKAKEEKKRKDREYQRKRAAAKASINQASSKKVRSTQVEVERHPNIAAHATSSVSPPHRDAVTGDEILVEDVSPEEEELEEEHPTHDESLDVAMQSTSCCSNHDSHEGSDRDEDDDGSVEEGQEDGSETDDEDGEDGEDEALDASAESDFLIKDDGETMISKMDSSNWVECNKDLLTVKVPNDSRVLHWYVMELQYRGRISYYRGYFSLAFELYSQATAVMEDAYSEHPVVKDNRLSALYRNQALLSVKLGHKSSSTEQYVRRAYNYSRNPSAAHMDRFLGHYLCHFPNAPVEQDSQKYDRIRQQLLANISAFDMRLSSEGSSINGIASLGGGSSLSYWPTVGSVKLPKHEQCTWGHLDLEKEHTELDDGAGRKRCCNCMRAPVTSDPKDPFYFDMFKVSSMNVSQTTSPFRLVSSTRVASTTRLHHICSHCYIMVRKKSKQKTSAKSNDASKKPDRWSYTWPSFYWNLLTGSDSRTMIPFHQSCGPATLLRFVPNELREYWKPALKEFTYEDRRIYLDETLQVPSHFEGRTLELKHIWEEIRNYDFKGMLRVMDPQRLKEEHRCPKVTPTFLGGDDAETWKARWQQSKMIPNVLCPWGCSEFIFRTKDFDPSLLIQYHLRTVQLNLPGNYDKMYLVETSRLDFIRDRLRECPDVVLLNEEWPILPTMLLYPGKGPVICTCRHHCGPSEWKRLTPHPPRKFKGMNLSASRPDQLCHAKLQPRIHKPLVAKGHNTVPMLSVFACSYAGSDCASVTTDRRWTNVGPRPMNFLHDSLAFDRPDIIQLADRMLEDGDISRDMYNEWKTSHELMASSPDFQHLKRGATYTPTINAIRLQVASSVENKVKTQVREVMPNGESRDVTISLQRSWCPAIGNMQVEDLRGYGWPMKAISFGPKKWKRSSMFMWSLLAMLSSSKELYHIVDQCEFGHSYKTPSGHLLTYVHHKIMKHCERLSIKKSPFKPTMSQGDLCTVMEEYLPIVYTEASHREEGHYMFGPRYFERIFRVDMFPKISVVGSVIGLGQDQVRGKDIFIVVSKEKPQGAGHFSVNGEKFEARVAMSVSTFPHKSKPDQWGFDSVLYSRWGGGFSKWWCQHRCAGARNLMLQSDAGNEEDDALPNFPDSFYYVVLYSRLVEHAVEDFKLDMHRSLGGQCSVFCSCGESKKPLVLSGIHDNERRVCMSNNCSKQELYACSTDKCETRICEKCHDIYTRASPAEDVILSPDICVNAPTLSSRPSNGGSNCSEDRNQTSTCPRDTDVDNPNGFDGVTEPGLVRTDQYKYGDGEEEKEEDDEDEVGPLDEEDDSDEDDDDCDDPYEINDVDLSHEEDNDGAQNVQRVNEESISLKTSLGDVPIRANIESPTGFDDADDIWPEFLEPDIVGEGSQLRMNNELPDVLPLPRNYYDEDNESVEDGNHSEGELGGDVHRGPDSQNQNGDYSVHEKCCPVEGPCQPNASYSPPNRCSLGSGSRFKMSKKIKAQCNARISAAGRHEGPNYALLDRFVTGADYDVLDPNAVDDINEDNVDTQRDVIPRVNGSEQEITLMKRNTNTDGRTCVPMHVLFNQAARMCTRYNKAIVGNRFQKNLVQKLVATTYGHSFPMLYFHALLFPKHFWSNAKNDRVATLGCAPISCFSKKVHTDGFASTLQQARMYATHASSSTSTDDHFTTYLYSMQANAAISGIDSRLATRSGFKVSTTSPSGLQLGNGDQSDLNESLESSQGAMNLAAAANELGMDAFITYTPNQKDHPGLRHLHQWKESRHEWGSKMPYYHGYPWQLKKDVDTSMEMAYTHVLTRCWLEVRKLWLEFIIFSVTHIGKEKFKVTHAFFRDEYQDCSGNLSHIHGLFGLARGQMDEKEFTDFICSLQANCVGDIIRGEEVDHYIKEGLLKDEGDWTSVKATASAVLGHTMHNGRCLRRVDYTGNFELDFVCRKLHPVFDSHDPLVDEFQDLPFVFSDTCLDILESIGLYEPPGPGEQFGKLNHKMLNPKRHLGICHPHDRLNMSPVHGHHFAFTRSMQNFQVITGTNGVTRYVVKYIIKLDKANRCVVWADSHSGHVLRAEKQFVHNSKITSSNINEEKAFARSRQADKPVGRFMGIPEMLHQLLGYSDIYTNMQFETIETLPFEYRSNTKIRLDRNGNLVAGVGKKKDKVSDMASLVTDSCSLRTVKLPADRHFTSNQQLLLQPTASSSASYCKVTLWGLRPVEILKLFPRLEQYYKWFSFDEKILSRSEISEGLKLDVTKCMWIDGLGRRVWLRKNACALALRWLQNMVPNTLEHNHSRILRRHLISVIEQGGCEDPTFIKDDKGEELPIVVFSRVQPNRASNFLLHVMLVLGEFDTELDLKDVSSMKESLAKAKLISDADADERTLLEDGKKLLSRIFYEILPLQPVTMPGMDDFIVKADQLIKSVLKHNTIPITDMPPSILTEVFNQRKSELEKEWQMRRDIQLDSILGTLEEAKGQLPSKDEVMKATKLDSTQVDWDPLDELTIPQGQEQSDASYAEQRLALRLGKKAVDRYCAQFRNGIQTKGILNNGAPGAGKTFVLQAQGLYAMCKGLRVMSSSLMAVRSNAIGGYHLHRLFQWEVGKMANLFRLAELAIQKLNRKTNIKFLHLLLTMDVLLLDECGQLSAQQFALIDIILRHVRDSALPFGGVLIFGTFDHHQLGAIEGLPFLLSSHILTDFTLVKLEHSVRAQGDKILQRIQQITRMSPYVLKKSKKLRKEFKDLITTKFKFVDSFSDPLITQEVLRLYHRKKSVSNAMAEFVRDVKRMLDAQSIDCKPHMSKDMKKTSESIVGLHETNDEAVVELLNNKVREPRELLFYRGALFHATCNSSTYAQSQTMLMIDMPTVEQLKNGLPIKLYAAPPRDGILEEVLNLQNVPTREDLLNKKWREVSVGVCKERFVTRDHTTACRLQYSLVHVGASTVNKQMGNTIYRPCAIEVTSEFFPWERGQVVVELSRNKKHEEIIFVGQKEEVAERLWQTLCVANRWTLLTESIVLNLSQTVGVRSAALDAAMVDIPDVFPWRICDQWIPNTNSGFVYLLISTVDTRQIYVGTTKNLAVRIEQHNRGYGSAGTACPDYLPWAVAAFIGGMSHLSRSERMAIEYDWQERNTRSRIEHRGNLEQIIENGRHIVSEHNRHNKENEDRKLSYIIMAQRRFALETAEEEEQCVQEVTKNSH